MARTCLYYSKKILLLICTLIFCLMLWNQYQNYISEKTGTTLSQETLSNMSFPAMTICSQYYDLGTAWKELGFPVNIFGLRPKGLKANPMQFYEMLERYELPVLPNLWRYYFTLDKVIKPTDKAKSVFCMMGNVICSPPKEIEPNTSLDEVTIPVEAGIWKSQFVADSQYGALLMCHTLTPNVTVDFSSLEGRTIGLTWQDSFLESTSYWKMYIHDKSEHFLPDTYAIKTMASFTFQKKHPLTRILIKSSLTKKPPPSKKHPCRHDEGYSENLCIIEWGWDKKLEIMEKAYGEKFQCQIPGIISKKQPRRPVCDNFYDLKNGTLGQLNLAKQDNLNKTLPRLGAPSVGSYKQSSLCIPRCTSIRYSLEEQVSLGLYDVTTYDLALYFDSPEVEVWEEYRLDSLLDFVAELGGSIGLILGMSMLTMISYMLDTLAYAWKRTSRENKKLAVKQII